MTLNRSAGQMIVLAAFTQVVEVDRLEASFLANLDRGELMKGRWTND